MENQSFFYQALIYLAAAVIAVPIFKRLGLGSVLGFLIAGMVIGPSGLGLINGVDEILGFSEFGVVLLLFLVGLELNVKRLWTLRRSILGMGSLQVLVTTFAIAVAAHAFGIHLSTALIIGMGFAMSSTAIALQTLTEKNLLNSAAGQASFSVLLFQDLAVIPIMIVLTVLSPTATSGINWLILVKAIALIVGLIIAGRYLLRPVFRFIASTGLREIFIAYSLLLVVGIALLMQSVGLSMALGTFLAGVMLADSEYRYQLELDIEPFKGLLLGLFFIAVGMSINLDLFLHHALLIFGIAIAVIIIKAFLLFNLARRFKESYNNSRLFALLLSQIGEFAFVIFNVAFHQQLLPKSTVDILNAVVALSMLSTPFLMMIYEKISPRFSKQQEREADVVDEKRPVIIAGFGRVGGVIARLLRGIGIESTVIDHDPDQIELVRRFGVRGYYGDITRLDLLHAAGAAKAKLIILAIDDVPATLNTIRLVKEHYPHLKVLARARARTDAFELVEEKVPVFRETFHSAIAMGEAALVSLGFSDAVAKRTAQQFQHHDETQLKQGARYRHDEKKLISLAQQGRAELEKLLKKELKK